MHEIAILSEIEQPLEHIHTVGDRYVAIGTCGHNVLEDATYDPDPMGDHAPGFYLGDLYLGSNVREVKATITEAKLECNMCLIDKDADAFARICSDIGCDDTTEDVFALALGAYAA